MKKLFFIIGAVSLMAIIASAVDAYSVRDVRDPRKLATKLTDDFTSVVSTSDSARVTVLEATAVTNATLTQSKAAVTATAVVTPLAGATVTATCVPATYTTNIITYLDATTNAVSSTNVIPATYTVAVSNGAGLLTNATAAVTVVNGGAVCTNVAITLIRQ